MTRSSLSWWLERLTQVERRSETEFWAICPAHQDVVPSLHLTVAQSLIKIHCFAGCSFASIVAALENQGPGGPEELSPVITFRGRETGPSEDSGVTPKTWWANYTGVPWSTWELLGTREELITREVAFTWPSTRVTKRRGVGGKKIHWFPPGDPTPPFWPEPPLHLRERIFITEGESDCGILRYCGHEAYALTKGANGVPARSIWEEMVLRGAKSFVLCLDLDTAGHEGSRKIQKVLQGLPGVTIEIFDPPKLPNPFIGATDLRDLFLQLGSVDAFNEFFSTALQGLGGTLISKTLDERLQEESSEPAWLWENYLAPASMTLIAGAPKVGKSTLLFALFSSFREGGVLLNARTRPCKVMFLTEERPGTLWDKRAQWGTMGHVSVVMRHEVMDQEWPALIERAAIEAQFLGCQVLVVDTLSEWAKIEDENDASLVNEALRCIQESCIPRNLGVFLVHHMRKSQGEHGSGIRGSSAFAASVEVILEYYRESGSRRRLEVISRFSGEFEPQMIGMERGRIFLADNLGNSRESREKAVLDTMSGGPKTPKEIADELGLSSESVRIWLGQLVRSGRVVTTGQGRRGDPRKFSLPTETNDHEDQDGD